RSEHFTFIIFQFWSDVTFGIDKGLSTNKCVGHLTRLTSTDLDVIAKHLVIAYFEGFDAGLFFESKLIFGHPRFAVMAEKAQLIQFSVIAIAKNFSISDA